VSSSSRDRRPYTHNRHGPKIGGDGPLGGVSAGSPCNIMRPGPRPTFVPSAILIHLAVLPQQTWAEYWGLCPLLLRGAGSPSDMTSLGSRPTSILSGILTIQPFGHYRRWPKFGGLCPFGGGLPGPHLTQYGLDRGQPACQV